MKQVFLTLCLFISIAAVTAQEETKPTLPFEVSGAVDAYYQYNFNDNAPGLTSFTGDHNSFSLGMAKFGLAKEIGKVSFGVDLGFGPRADAANGYSGTSFASIQQMFVAYAPTDKLSFTFGNFGTHVGYELIDAKDNFHYSTSYMFSYGPFYHTGLKANYQVSEKIGLMLGIFDDTDNKFDVVPGKHIGAQVSFALDNGDVYVNYLSGTDGLDTVSFNQIDLTAAFALSDKFNLGLNSTIKSIVADDEEKTTANWYGAAVYLDYALSENFTLGLRTEYFNDSSAAIFGVDDLSIIDVTLSGNIAIDALTIIPEIRIDSASSDIFTDADGAATGVSPSFLLAVVYEF